VIDKKLDSIANDLTRQGSRSHCLFETLAKEPDFAPGKLSPHLGMTFLTLVIISYAKPSGNFGFMPIGIDVEAMFSFC